MIRFAARTTHPWALRGWIWVTVHDTVEELRIAARNGQDHSTALAVFQPAPIRISVGPADETLPQQYAGLMRVTRDVDATILAHECVHAAAALWRRQRGLVVDLGDGVAEPEEAFAYVVGDLVGAVVGGLYRAGVWPRSA